MLTCLGRLRVLAALAPLAAAVLGSDCEGGAAGECAAGAARSLLQARARRLHRDDPSAPCAWTASSFGYCMPECGNQRFRSVACAFVYDGGPASDAVCTGARPASAAPCVCGGVEACATPPAGGCPRPDAGSGTDPGGYVRVGCFAAPESAGEKLHDKTCMNWTAAKPCKGGLPFYAVGGKGMAVDKCYRFCVSKGMDIFGLTSGKICRCGASALNKEVWHKESPRPGLLFDPSKLQEAKPGGAAAGCPLEVYRYAGHYADGGVPSSYWDIKEYDLEYVDSVVTGKNVDEGIEEDGAPAREMKEGLQLEQKPREAPGFDRHREDGAPAREMKEGLQVEKKPREAPGFDRPCWPGNCGPGRGPWGGRSSVAPAGTKDVWEEYVLVDYVFEPWVDNDRRAAFHAAVEEWRDNTCINFIEQKTQPVGPHILVGIRDTMKCYLVGMGNGTSFINLGWCNSKFYLGSMIHNIGHALGMNHEQTRPDATKNYHGHGPYLRMYWDQVPRDQVHLYEPDDSSYTGSAIDGPSDPHAGWAEYDFGSIMHYPGGRTFDTIPANKEDLLGNRRSLSPGDVEQILDMYQCRRAPTPAPPQAPLAVSPRQPNDKAGPTR